MLIPLAAITWSYLLKLVKHQSKAFYLPILISLSLVGHANNLDFSLYSWISAEKEKGLECLKTYYQTKTPTTCPSIWSAEISAKAQLSKKLGLSFTRHLGPVQK